jgi:hypothetical protein
MQNLSEVHQNVHEKDSGKLRSAGVTFTEKKDLLYT